MRHYLDHNATAPLAPEAVEAMRPWLRSGTIANPSSLHREGRAARAALEDARDAVAAVLGMRSANVVFTSGATEANHLGLSDAQARAQAAGRAGPLWISAVEHAAVERWTALSPCGSQVLPVDEQGRLSLKTLQAAAAASRDRPARALALIGAGNETGSVQALATIASFAKKEGLPFHIDATQMPGRCSLEDLGQAGVSSAAFGGHKFGGPHGAGVLFLTGSGAQPGELPERGGAQERGRRAGTENVAACVGLAAALRAAESGREERCRRLRQAEAVLRAGLSSGERPFRLVPIDEPKLPGVIAADLPGVAADALALAADLAGFALGTGAACSSGASRPSPVWTALGLPPEQVAGMIRLSLGPGTTAEDAADIAAGLCALALKF